MHINGGMFCRIILLKEENNIFTKEIIVLYSDLNRKLKCLDEMGGECSMHASVQKFIQNFSRRDRKERPLEDAGVDSIILKCVLKKKGAAVAQSV
jgi:hypothetical protein